VKKIIAYALIIAGIIIVLWAISEPQTKIETKCFNDYRGAHTCIEQRQIIK